MQSPGVCINSVAPKNLCSLIESSSEHVLAESILKHMMVSQEREVANADSAYLRAAWFLFRNHSELLPKDLLRDTLLWASKFAYDADKVRSDAEQKTRYLCKQLVEVTQELLEQAADSSPHKRERFVQTHYIGRCLMALDCVLPKAERLYRPFDGSV